MGALKHVLIPFYTCLHLLGSYKALDPKGFVEFCGLPLTENEEQTAREAHLIGVILSFHLAMAFLCFLGFFQESAHFRGIIMVCEVLFYGVRTVHAYSQGLDSAVYSKPGFAAAVAVVGVVLHSMEPGLFTKDKKDETKKSN